MPYRRTKTLRGASAHDARRHLFKYRNLLKYEGTEHDDQAARVTALLWAQAQTERALALETMDRLGDKNSTPSRIIARNDDAPTAHQVMAAEREAVRHG